MELELNRDLPAPPDVVFAAFADPASLAQWWGPGGFTIPAVDFDPRPGRSYRIEMQPPEGDAFFLHGVFREVDPPARLAFSFVWEPADPDDVETVADLTFAAHGDGTRVTLTHGPFGTEARRDLHRDGWTESFDKLQRRMSAT